MVRISWRLVVALWREMSACTPWAALGRRLQPAAALDSSIAAACTWAASLMHSYHIGLWVVLLLQAPGACCDWAGFVLAEHPEFVVIFGEAQQPADQLLQVHV
jgi:hypothetical protein